MLIDLPLFCNQAPVQSAKSLQIKQSILHRGREPGRHSLVCRKSIQTHQPETGVLPCPQGWYVTSQPIPGFFILEHNGSPLSPEHINKPGGEPLFRELIHKPAKSSLNVSEVIFGDLSLQIALTDNGHPDALPSGCGMAKLPSSSGPLGLPTPRSAPGQI